MALVFAGCDGLRGREEASCTWLGDKLRVSYGAGPSSASLQRSVLIWHGERPTDGHLAFMYWPVLTTLIEGFRSSRPSLRTVVGVGSSRALQRELAALRRGDAFVWMGPRHKRAQPWPALRRRGVRTVYYQTEPGHHCEFLRRDVDELWDYSWHNVDACARIGRAAPTLRFVPPGAVASAPAPVAGNSTSLLFFGSTASWTGRERCFAALRRSLGDALVQTYAVWTDAGLAALLRQYDCFLNVHKNCERGHAPVTFRHALLLSAGKLLLSERAYPRDEAEYEGMVTFVDRDHIPREYRRLLARRAAWRADAARAYARFRRGFSPARLFARAGIFREWNASSG